jgi:putative transposase
VHVSRKRVARLMRQRGLIGRCRRRWTKTTISDPEVVAVDLLKRAFGPGTVELDRAWVGDITYIWTWEGWLYLATVIDCFNREVIGYAMADHLRTELVTAALDMAERNHDLAKDCIIHSDHGTQYTSAQFAAKLAALELRQSLGRTGICYDNALAESFFGTLKNERVYRTVYPTRKKAKDDIARYIEIFYNRQRLHSGLGYRTPHDVRNEHLNRQLAA